VTDSSVLSLGRPCPSVDARDLIDPSVSLFPADGSMEPSRMDAGPRTVHPSGTVRPIFPDPDRFPDNGDEVEW
jgi:hypothetical protein